VTGLAWTSVGGDILLESLISQGKGTMTITGNLDRKSQQQLL
jgi:ATP-dependent Lon protease